MAILTLVTLAGCMAPDRIAYGPQAAATASIEGYSDIRTYADATGKLPAERAWLPVSESKEINYLVVSGGGSGGAFTVGALKAWSDRGDRPKFNIVSGVSTGALIAPYAFLGSAYDKPLVDLYISGVAKDLVAVHFLPTAMMGASLLQQAPLRAMVERYLTSDVLAKIATEHRNGRRLVVLTADIDSQRAVIWNMGAIASSGRPDALKLFQDIILASASIPGLFPAVLIKVRSGEEVFEEMHSDGSLASAILTIPEGWMTSSEVATWPQDQKINLYIIINNALIPEFEITRNNTFTVFARASSSLIKSQTRSALLSTYIYARAHGIQFRFASIDSQVPYKMIDPFNTGYMRAVYKLGYSEMASGRIWKVRPIFTNTLDAAQPVQQSQ